MSRNSNGLSRRRFLRTGTLAVAAVTTGALLTSRPARSQDLPKLSEDSPMAQALKYHHDASEVQGGRQQGALCSNCQLFTAVGDGQWGTCTAFPGKLVNADGWCSAWVKAS